MKIHSFELSSTLTNEKYYNIQNSLKLKDKNKWKAEPEGMLYFGLRDNGILINMFRIKKKGFYSYRIIYRIFASRVIDKDNYLDLLSVRKYDELEAKANKLLKDKSDDLPKLQDCKPTRIDFCFNAELDNQQQVKAYIKTIKRGNIPHGHQEFMLYDQTAKRSKPTKDDFTVGAKDFVEVSIYNKHRQMKKDKFFPLKEIERATDIVRIEIRCKKKLIKKLSKKFDIYTIKEFMEYGEDIGEQIYHDYLLKISGSGSIYTLKETLKRIDMSEFRKKDIVLMREFVRDINSSRSATEVINEYKVKYSKAIVKRMLSLFEDIATNYITATCKDAELFPLAHIPPPLELYEEFS